MSLALVAALALSPSAYAAHCSWDEPGADPFMGNVPAAVDRYTDIPADVRERLKARMVKRDFDEMATIRRDSITGRHRYGAEIRDMHFGQGKVCKTVSRSKWAPEAVERGLVYCEAEHCIIVPTVCRNVSRVKRLPGPTAQAPGGEGGMPGGLMPGGGAAGDPGAPGDGVARPLAANDSGVPGELLFDPPGAGNPSFSQASQPQPSTPLAGSGGGGGVPLAETLGGLPILAATPEGGAGGGGPGGNAPPDSAGPGGSAFQLPPGAPPPTGGSGFGSGPGPGRVVPDALEDFPTIPPMTQVPVIPEPSTWALLLAGLAAMVGLAQYRRRR